MSLRFCEFPDEVRIYLTVVRAHEGSRAERTFAEPDEICSLAASGGKRLIVDCHDFDAVSSATIGRLVLLNRCAKQYGVELGWSHVSRKLAEVFRVMKFQFVFSPDDDGPDPS